MVGVHGTTMKASDAPFDTVESCPNCGAVTRVVKLGPEPAREFCPNSCDFDGVTLE